MKLSRIKISIILLHLCDPCASKFIKLQQVKSESTIYVWIKTGIPAEPKQKKLLMRDVFTSCR